MKTLLITGTTNTVENKDKITYNISLFGQTDETPEITFICGLNNLKCDNYGEMISLCKKYFCEYFKVDDFNIITMQNLILKN